MAHIIRFINDWELRAPRVGEGASFSFEKLWFGFVLVLCTGDTNYLKAALAGEAEPAGKFCLVLRGKWPT